jgi:hypothetical protein
VARSDWFAVATKVGNHHYCAGIDDEPSRIARLFWLPILPGDLPRHADTEAEPLCRPLRLQEVQNHGAPVVGKPIQLCELDGAARKAGLIQRLISSIGNP